MTWREAKTIDVENMSTPGLTSTPLNPPISSIDFGGTPFHELLCKPDLNPCASHFMAWEPSSKVIVAAPVLGLIYNDPCTVPTSSYHERGAETQLEQLT